MQKLIQSLFFLILLSPGPCWTDKNAKPQMEIWVHLAYPSQYVLERSRPMLLHLNEVSGIHLTLKGGNDLSKPLATCAQGTPMLIAASLFSAMPFIEKCHYKALVQTESRVHLVVNTGNAIIDVNQKTRIGTLEGHPIERLARLELGDKTKVVSYTSFISLLKAYRNKEIDALTLPDHLLVPGTALRRRWQTIHIFEGTVAAVIIASPLLLDEEFTAIQNALLSLQTSSTDISASQK